MIKKENKFKKFLILYISILSILTIIIALYVKSTLEKFEKNQIDNFVENLIIDLKEYACKNEISKYIDEVNVNIGEFERKDASVINGLTELLKSDVNIKYELNSNSTDELNPIYDIYVDDNKIFEVSLDGTNTETRLSLFTFSNWKVSYINVEAQNGLMKFNISVPQNCEVYVNDKILTESEKIILNTEEGISELSKYVEIPCLVKYEINGLVEKPEYKIIDKNGVEISKEDIKLDDEVKNFETLEEAKNEINNLPDILKIAKKWSLFVSNDLEGKCNGFYNISEHLIKDSYLYNYAYKWATNIDITFISNHTLKNPAFTNDTVSDFIVYNSKAFSCDVHLEKNMRVANDKDLTDKMNERMYFAYYDDTNDNIKNPSWKLVNMQSITANSDK